MAGPTLATVLAREKLEATEFTLRAKNHTNRNSAHGENAMMTEPKFVDVEGVKTRYFDRGSGHVILLVHGSHMGTPDACESALDWEFNFDVLARRYRVIAMDKLGQGYTGTPKTDADYTIAATIKHA